MFRIRQEIRVETALLTPLGLNLCHPYCDYFPKRQVWIEEDLAVSETIKPDFTRPVELLMGLPHWSFTEKTFVKQYMMLE